MSTARRIARAAAAAAALGVLLFGLPAALWWLGSPLLPSRMPDWSTVVGVLTRPDDGRLLLGFLVVVGFVTWAVLSLSIVLELVAALRQRSAPVIALPGFRPARLLAGVLVSALLGAGSAGPAAATPSLVAVSVVAPPAAEPVAPEAPSGRVHVVAPRDTLWTIAESELGDALRWREIYDLNAGRPQSDGGRLDDAGRLTVGWHLVLPDTSETDAAPDDHAAVVVRKGDTLTEIARDRAGSAERADDIFTANAGVPQQGGGALRDPDEIQIGWRFVIPQPRQAPDQEAPPRTSAPSPPPSAAPSGTASPPTTAHDVPERTSGAAAPRPAPPATSSTPAPVAEPVTEDDGLPATALAMMGISGAVAAAFIVALTRRRTRQRRLRPAGHALPVPDDAAGRVEWAAAQEPRAQPLHYVDLAFRCLTPDVAAELAVVAVQWTPESAVVTLGEPVAAAPPFRTAADGSWTLQAAEELPIPVQDAAATCAPVPALVAIATAGDATLMIDLEHRGVLRVGGNPDRSRALLRHMAAELATSAAAEDVEIVLVDLDDELVDLDPERVTVAASLGDALGTVQRRAAATRDALTRFSLTTVIEGRLRAIAPDSWLPTVVLCGTELGPDDLALLEALKPGAATAVVVLDTGLPDLVVRDDGTLDLDDTDGDPRWEATQLTQNAGTQLATVLHTADVPAVPVGPAPTGDDRPWADGMGQDGALTTPVPPVNVDPEAERQLAIVEHQDPTLDDDLAQWLDPTPPPAPMIGILGAPVVRAPGTPPKVRASWFAEVLVYLSLHPAGVSSAKAVTDLWPDGHRISPATIRHAFYGARRWAGRGLGADPAVPFVSEMNTDTSYRLRGHLLDWDLFRRLRKRAQARHRAGHPGASDDYEAALALVRGPVLHPLRPGGYAWLNNHDQRHDLQIPGFVVDTAHELVEIALAAGDTGRARRIAEQARAIDVDVVYDRPLTDLMRIAHAEDNQAELEFYAAALLDARGFEVPEELSPESFTVLNDLLPAGLHRPPRS